MCLLSNNTIIVITNSVVFLYGALLSLPFFLLLVGYCLDDLFMTLCMLFFAEIAASSQGRDVRPRGGGCYSEDPSVWGNNMPASMLLEG